MIQSKLTLKTPGCAKKYPIMTKFCGFRIRENMWWAWPRISKPARYFKTSGASGEPRQRKTVLSPNPSCSLYFLHTAFLAIECRTWLSFRTGAALVDWSFKCLVFNAPLLQSNINLETPKTYKTYKACNWRSDNLKGNWLSSPIFSI